MFQDLRAHDLRPFHLSRAGPGQRRVSRRAHVTGAVAVQVQAVHLVAEPFSIDNGLLTPSFKLKRPQAKEAFADAITAMYRRLDR